MTLMHCDECLPSDDQKGSGDFSETKLGANCVWASRCECDSIIDSPNVLLNDIGRKKATCDLRRLGIMGPQKHKKSLIDELGRDAAFLL